MCICKKEKMYIWLNFRTESQKTIWVTLILMIHLKNEANYKELAQRVHSRSSSIYPNPSFYRGGYWASPSCSFHLFPHTSSPAPNSHLSHFSAVLRVLLMTTQEILRMCQKMMLGVEDKVSKYLTKFSSTFGDVCG
jgi:hypothetical protein